MIVSFVFEKEKILKSGKVLLKVIKNKPSNLVDVICVFLNSIISPVIDNTSKSAA